MRMTSEIRVVSIPSNNVRIPVNLVQVLGVQGTGAALDAVLDVNIFKKNQTIESHFCR